MRQTILILLLFSMLFMMSCKKADLPKVSKPLERMKITLEEVEKKEGESLLKALRQKNPFRADHATGLILESTGGTDLKGIVWDNQTPFAIIGESVVKEGDSLGGKKVIKINRNSVVLGEEGGSQTTLRLEEEIVK